MFLQVPAYPGCPGSKAVKRSSQYPAELSRHHYLLISGLMNLSFICLGYWYQRVGIKTKSAASLWRYLVVSDGYFGCSAMLTL